MLGWIQVEISFVSVSLTWRPERWRTRTRVAAESLPFQPLKVSHPPDRSSPSGSFGSWIKTCLSLSLFSLFCWLGPSFFTFRQPFMFVLSLISKCISFNNNHPRHIFCTHFIINFQTSLQLYRYKVMNTMSLITLIQSFSPLRGQSGF